MAKEKVYTWSVACCNTSGDGVNIWRVKGTRAQVKKHLLAQVKDFKNECEDDYEYGDETLNAIESHWENSATCVNAFATCCDYHVDWTATVEDEPIDLSAKAAA